MVTACDSHRSSSRSRLSRPWLFLHKTFQRRIDLISLRKAQRYGEMEIEKVQRRDFLPDEVGRWELSD